MEPIKFKTNIKCAGCVEKITPYLNEAVGEGHWQVDYNNPLKILTVDDERQKDNVIHALEKAGYKAEAIQK